MHKAHCIGMAVEFPLGNAHQLTRYCMASSVEGAAAFVSVVVNVLAAWHGGGMQIVIDLKSRKLS